MPPVPSMLRLIVLIVAMLFGLESLSKASDEASQKGTIKFDDSGFLNIDLDFPGGSVAEYLDLVDGILPKVAETWRKSYPNASGFDQSIVRHDDCALVRMPPVRLRGAMLVSVIELVGTLVPGVRVTQNPPPGKYTPGRDADGKQTGGTPVVYIISVIREELNPSDYIAPKSAVLDIDFPGGTLQQYIDHLRKAAPKMNVAMFGEVSSIRMPAIRMTDVPYVDAMKALQALPSEHGSIVDVISQGDVFLIRSSRTSEARVETVVEDVSGMIAAGSKQEDILSAVQAVIEIGGANIEARFHEPTSLLILRGRPADLVAVVATVDKLRQR